MNYIAESLRAGAARARSAPALRRPSEASRGTYSHGRAIAPAAFAMAMGDPIGRPVIFPADLVAQAMSLGRHLLLVSVVVLVVRVVAAPLTPFVVAVVVLVVADTLRTREV